MSAAPGAEDYREGALARLEDARRLREQQRWVGAVYLVGWAVEGIRRSLLWIQKRNEEVGHDLRDPPVRAQSLGIIANDDTSLRSDINEVAIVWRNNLRFVGESRFARDLRDLGRSHRIAGRKVRGNPVKANALYLSEVCERIVSRGESIWYGMQSKPR